MPFPISKLLKLYFAYSIIDGSFPVKITEIKLSPDPLVLRKGARVTFGGKFKVAGDAGTQYKLHLSLKKKVWVWVPLPCIRNVGSW